MPSKLIRRKWGYLANVPARRLHNEAGLTKADQLTCVCETNLTVHRYA